MLKRLSIRDYAIIDSLDLDVAKGFTVLSGETGAGKSILIDALGLLLGDRSDGAMVRSGRERAELSAEFSLDAAEAARAWLTAQELLDADDAGHCLIRRVIGSDGRSRAFINASTVTLGQLRELGETLVEIHGQHEHQRLTAPDTQRALLDESGVPAATLNAVQASAQQYKKTAEALARAQTLVGRDPAQLDYLREQLRELELLKLEPGEIETLSAEHRGLAHAGRLMSEGAQAQDLLYGAENNLHDQLNSVETLLLGLSELHDGFTEYQTLIAQARLQTREAAEGLRRLLDRLDLDPERMAEVEQRMASIHELARKHRVKPDQLPDRLAALQTECSELELAAGGMEKLQAEQAAALKKYQVAAKELTAARKKAATALAQKVTKELRELGMPQAQLVISIEPANSPLPRPCGDDDVRFDFSANPGQVPRPLSKVASGGELSRVSLAIQVIALQKSAPQTLVFDEVDAGIGGAVAEIVGQKLHRLAQRGQALCVTHLPQVAAQGDQHLGIRKEMKAGQTFTRVSALEGKTRVAELSRMLGGQKVTEATEALAKDMLKTAASG